MRSSALALSLVACGPRPADDEGGAGDGITDPACEAAPTQRTVLHSAMFLAVDDAGSIVVQGCRVYWTSQEGEFAGEASSMRKDGTDLRRHIEDVYGLRDIDVVDDRVFALHDQGLASVPEDASEPPTTIVQGPGNTVATTDTAVYVFQYPRMWRFDLATAVLDEVEIFQTTSAITAAGETVYLSTDAGLFALDGDDNSVQLIASVPAARELIADTSSLYLVVDETIVGVDLASGSSETIVESASAVTHVALDADHLYWSDGGSGEPYREGGIWAWPRDGGQAFLVAAAETPRGIAVDETALYWTTESAGELVRSPKP